MNYVLAPKRFEQISQLARTLWHDFREYAGPVNVGDILGVPAHRVDSADNSQHYTFPQELASFASFCASLKTGRPAFLMDHSLSASELHPNRPFALLVLTGKERPLTIVVDLAHLRNQIDGRNLFRFVLLLVLHEVGHIVLHFDDFVAPTNASRQLLADPAQEAEAWLFASMVLGIVMGDRGPPSVLDIPELSSLVDSIVWETE
jgi:hypothetical protein